jgi:hypothetical protein
MQTTTLVRRLAQRSRAPYFSKPLMWQMIGVRVSEPAMMPSSWRAGRAR